MGIAASYIYSANMTVKLKVALMGSFSTMAGNHRGEDDTTRTASASKSESPDEWTTMMSETLPSSFTTKVKSTGP